MPDAVLVIVKLTPNKQSTVFPGSPFLYFHYVKREPVQEVP